MFKLMFCIKENRTTRKNFRVGLKLIDYSEARNN